MKRTVLSFVCITLLATACSEKVESEVVEETITEEVTEETAAQTTEMFGDVIDEANAINVNEIALKMGESDSLMIKVAGTIGEVCQKKGCWMKVAISEEEEMMVRFKDYAFFMPLDAAGRDVIFEGFVFQDTTSVEMLQHYAEDAGKSEEEIASITEAEIALTFEASGVILK